MTRDWICIVNLVGRMQNCGCPYRDVLRMCRAFRNLPTTAKKYVCAYGLTYKDEAVLAQTSCNLEIPRNPRNP